MKIEKTDIDNLNAELSIKIEESDYKNKVEQSLKNYRKQAVMPGFRAGKVPMGMIRKMAGNNILVDEINQMLSENLHKYITEEDIDILGNPLPKKEQQENIDWENQKDFEFIFELGLKPEVKVSLNDKIKIDRNKVKVTDKMVNEQIDEMAKQYGKMVSADEVEKGDMLYGTFHQLEKDSPKEEGISHQTTLNLNAIKKEADRKKFFGKKVGDSLKLKPQNIADEATVASWLDIDPKYIQELKAEFQFEIEKINRMIPTEINTDFFDKIYGEGVVKSKEEMQSKVREEMEKGFETHTNQLFERDVQDFLMKKAKLQLPDEFMKKWLQSASEQPITAEQIEEEYENYSDGFKWQLIENKIIRDHQIQLTQEEVKQHAIQLIRKQLAGMGQNFMDEQQLEETADRILSNQEETKRISDELLREKLNKLYQNTVKVKEREISYDDFVKLAEKKR